MLCRSIKWAPIQQLLWMRFLFLPSPGRALDPAELQETQPCLLLGAADCCPHWETTLPVGCVVSRSAFSPLQDDKATLKI